MGATVQGSQATSQPGNRTWQQHTDFSSFKAMRVTRNLEACTRLPESHRRPIHYIKLWILGWDGDPRLVQMQRALSTEWSWFMKETVRFLLAVELKGQDGKKLLEQKWFHQGPQILDMQFQDFFFLVGWPIGFVCLFPLLVLDSICAHYFSILFPYDWTIYSIPLDIGYM